MATLSLAQLADRQLELFKRISNAPENLDKLGGEISHNTISARFAVLRKNWSEFQANHLLILSQKYDTTKQIDYFANDCYGLSEEAFLDSSVYMSSKLREFLAPVDPDAPAMVAAPSCRKLPNVEVPDFSGRFADWIPFKDLFTATVINDSRLAAVEKLQQLKMHIRGEAADMLRTVEVNNANFEVAWKTLQDYYANKRRLVAMHVANLLDLPAMISESPAELKALINNTTNALKSLEQLKRPTSSWDDLVVSLTVRKLDASTLREWETLAGKSAEPPTFSQLLEFILQHVTMLETVAETQRRKPTKRPDTRSANSACLPSVKSTKCALCNAEHFLLFCPDLKAKSSSDRRRFVEEKRLCFNCLGYHKASDCRSQKRCHECAGRHHSMLHEGSPVNTSANLATLPTAPSTLFAAHSADSTFAPKQKLLLHVSAQCSIQRPTLLATALVRLRAADGKLITARAMIDPGSQCSFVAEGLRSKLELPRGTLDYSIGVLGCGNLPVRGYACLQLMSRNEERVKLTMNVLILPLLKQYRPSPHVLSGLWEHLRGLDLADDFTSPPSEVEILIGMDDYPEMLLEGLKKGPKGSPMAVSTTFGWTLCGSIEASSHLHQRKGISSCNHAISASTGWIAAKL